MTQSMDELLSSAFSQRLRRLGLLQDERHFPELDAAEVPKEVQLTLLGNPGTRSAIRFLVNREGSGLSLTLTEQLIFLEHLRLRPAKAAPLVATLTDLSLGVMLAERALNSARSLQDEGRARYAKASVDSAVNYMLEAQAEFLFALSTGFLPSRETTEALGKYAVAVAISSRWRRTSRRVLERALRYHQNSIATGNNSPEAYEYLVELLAELFNATSDASHLDKSIEIATENGLGLALGELRLKRGVYRRRQGDGGFTPDLQAASKLAADASPRTGVEHVQRALVRELALSAIIEPCPLEAEQIRLPYGFLRDLAQLDDERCGALRKVVLDALIPMRAGLKEGGQQPNLVAQQLLFAVLRDSLSRRGLDADANSDLLVDVASETRDKGGDRYLDYQYVAALLARADARADQRFASDAIAEADALIRSYPDWPLPLVARAAALTLRDELTSAEGVAAQAPAAWADAAKAVVDSPDYRRSDLGGRSSVFAIEDARGDLATALVFKPVTDTAGAEREAEYMKQLSAAVRDRGLEARFGVPRSLSIVTRPASGAVHVIERQAGELLSDLDPSVTSEVLPKCVEFLALFHNAVDRPEQGRSAWRRLKNELKLWSRALFPDQTASEEFVASMKETQPLLQLVKKRDAHAGNWVIDGAGRVIAVDLEASSDRPVGHDVAQLIEDAALLPVSPKGFEHRHSLLISYLDRLDFGVCEDEAITGYGWFALHRATWLASSASASKAQHTHARQLAQYLASGPDFDAIRSPAEKLAGALRQPVGSSVAGVDAAHRGKSKRLSQVLRHRVREFDLAVDAAGFVSIDDLVEKVDMSVDEVVTVVTHPAEPRFELEEGRVRALYGHSFAVSDLPDLDVEPPDTLFHGTSWSAVARILSDGLQPMGRHKVHLTNNPTEALEVARRHSQPALLAVPTLGTESLQAVADAVWAADSIPPELLEIRNPFTEISAPPDWLAEATGESRDGGTGR